MVERVDAASTEALAEVAQLLHDFNVEYDEPTPPPQQLAERLAQLARDDRLVVLLARPEAPPANVAEATSASTTPTTSDIRSSTTAPTTRPPAPSPAVGVAVLRLHPSLWSEADEAYLAELYVVPAHRGHGHGRDLLAEALSLAREQGADYAFLVTSEADRLAQRVYEAAGFRRTEGEGGPPMWAYELEL